jgi:hypothetical protein
VGKVSGQDHFPLNKPARMPSECLCVSIYLCVCVCTYDNSYTGRYSNIHVCTGAIKMF